MIPRLALLAIVLAALGGCTRSRILFGNPVQPSEAAAIAPGETKAGVLTRLGPPDRVELEMGGSAFEYLYTRSAERNLDLTLFQSSFTYDEARQRVDRLRISFDANGMVRWVAVVPGHDTSMPD